jgi:hypothetical protein
MNKSILDPTFNYVPAEHTDIRKTFERIRQEMATIQSVSKVRKLTNMQSQKRNKG